MKTTKTNDNRIPVESIKMRVAAEVSVLVLRHHDESLEFATQYAVPLHLNPEDLSTLQALLLDLEARLRGDIRFLTTQSENGFEHTIQSNLERHV